MIKRLRWVCIWGPLTLLLALPFGALADEDGWGQEGLTGDVTVGGAGVGLNRDSAKFGEYTGIDESGGFFFGSADLHYDRKGYYADFQAETYGSESSHLYLEAGKYDDYKFLAEYDRIPHLLSDNSKTILKGSGGTRLKLPAGYTLAPDTSTMDLSGDKDVELEIDGRNRARFGLAKTLGQTEFNLSYMRETKDGLMSLGGVMGTNAGNAKSIVFPQSFDQTVNEVQASIAHNREDTQIQLDFFFSHFDNLEESLVFDTPFTMAAGGGNNPPLATTGLIQTLPDNQHWKISLSGGINLPYSTRISGIAEYGEMTQNDNLLPFARGTSASLLPRKMADAEIDTINLGLNVSSSPLPGLGLSARFQHYRTINETPKDIFLMIHNDDPGGVGAQAAIEDGEALFNLPYDQTRNQLDLEASYYVFKGTTVSAGYGFELVDRENRAVEETLENKVHGGFRSNFFSFASLRFKFSYSMKEGLDDYDSGQVFSSRHTKEHILDEGGTPGVDLFDEHPLLRRYDIADRDRKKIDASLNLLPVENVALGFHFNYRDDDYDESQLGIQESMDHSITVDLNVSHGESTNFYAYYTYQNLEATQASRAFGGSAPDPADPAGNWFADHDDVVNTVGAGVNHGFWNNTVTLGADYSYSESVTDIDFRAGSHPSVSMPKSMPDLKTQLHTLKATGRYQYAPNLGLGISYLFENYSSDDFSTDGVAPASSTLDNVLTLSGSIPDYDAHVGMVFVTFHFGER